MPDFLGGLMGEMKQHPWTTTAAGVALAGVLVMFPTYLKAQAIERRMAGVERVQKQSLKETLINRRGSLKSALFDITSKIDEFRSRGLPIDSIYYDEIKRLNNEIDKVDLTLEELNP